MSTANQRTPTAFPKWKWTEADLDALCASDIWFSTTAPPELRKQYVGMYVAILGEEVIDADRDFDALGQRIEAQGDTIPMNRLLFRYVPTSEEALSRF